MHALASPSANALFMSAAFVALVMLTGCAHRPLSDSVVLPPRDVTIVSSPPGFQIRAFGGPAQDDFIDRYFPSRSAELGLSGRSTVECKVSAEGAMTSCEIIEDPQPRQGFGEAAMRVMKRGAADPNLLPAGSSVRVSFDFVNSNEVDVECDISIERIARNCRVVRSFYADQGSRSKALTLAEGAAPPASVSALHRGPARWRLVVPIAAAN